MKSTNKDSFDASEFIIEPAECLDMRKGNMPPLVVDLRSSDDFSEEHLAGANSLPAEFLLDNLMRIPPFAKIVLYGGDDDDATTESVKLLWEQGFTNISYVKGGFQALMKEIRSSEDEVFLGDLPQEEWSPKIEAVLDEKIRPVLASDGGGMEVLKIEDNQVYIRYQGACSGCASSTTGTLRFIQTSLSIALNYDIEVISA